MDFYRFISIDALIDQKTCRVVDISRHCQRQRDDPTRTVTEFDLRIVDPDTKGVDILKFAISSNR
jgi:hypothetical protein